MRQLVLLLFCMGYSVGFSQPISAAQQDSLLTSVKALLNRNFVSIDKAKLIADSLQIADFKDVTDHQNFIKQLNQRLFQYTNDQHLAVEYNPNYAKELASHNDQKADQAAREKRENYGFDTPQILTGNIGYLKLNYFADTSMAKQAAFQSITHLEKTKSLILDLRGNSGGSGSMIQLLCSMFLGTPAHPLLQIAYRQGDTVTLKTYPKKLNPIYSKPLFILCDDKTFSAGEAFTLIMKNRGRATVIGRPTAGAGNIAGPYYIGSDYIITIPVGRIVDPLTQTGWDGVGVQPTIDTKDNDALEAAKRLAIESQR